MPKKNRDSYTSHKYRGITIWIPGDMKFEEETLSICVREYRDRKLLVVPSASRIRKKG